MVSDFIRDRLLPSAKDSDRTSGYPLRYAPCIERVRIAVLLKDIACYRNSERAVASAGKTVRVDSAQLRYALDNDQLWVAYQPKVDCVEHVVSAFELLARWQHPVLGDISPREFIPIAEASGVIGELTLNLVECGLQWLSELPHDHELALCVNLSATLFDDPHFPAKVSTLCKRYELLPRSIIFELSEAKAPLHASHALAFVTRLRINGFSVAIDDVGSGYSSLFRLSKLPYSEMKIDRDVLLETASTNKQRLVLEYLVHVGHSIGLAVVAEGVEDKAALDLVKSVGCDLVQGNYISRPMSGLEARAWYAEKQPLH